MNKKWFTNCERNIQTPNFCGKLEIRNKHDFLEIENGKNKLKLYFLHLLEEALCITKKQNFCLPKNTKNIQRQKNKKKF